MRSLEVVEAGPLTTVQDHGRIGWAHLGVPRAGALDGPAAEAAQRLVGNPPDLAVLEITAGGFSARLTASATIAVTGAGCSVSVDGRPAAFGEAVSVIAGSLVRLGAAVTGVRCYLAVAGGIDVTPVLGSRSTDTLAGVGPPRVRDGDILPIGQQVGPPADGLVPAYADRDVVLRYRPGPRAEWFADVPTSAYAVSPVSNRVGLRLVGPALRRVIDGELPSEGLVAGAIQVPGDGTPLIFLADHPTTGGYPVVGVVDAAALAVCGQLRPGTRVLLRPT